ncbi:MAG: hypothetical protein OIF56_05120 [Cohaesibacter sp.]|nr:hypothetical protein [Cohaesibacter sp.]
MTIISKILTTAALMTTFTIMPASIGSTEELTITPDTFSCISELTPVRGFFIGNLKGNLDATLAVAKSETGGKYPEGSIIQLIPTEAMVKREAGFNTKTNDWEFFELTVSKQGTEIHRRGFEDVVNRFGGNCFECHERAEEQWDMVCEMEHGCDPISVSRAMSRALQKTDPRCASTKLTEEEAEALQDFKDMFDN